MTGRKQVEAQERTGLGNRILFDYWEWRHKVLRALPCLDALDSALPSEAHENK